MGKERNQYFTILSLRQVSKIYKREKQNEFL